MTAPPPPRINWSRIFLWVFVVSMVVTITLLSLVFIFGEPRDVETPTEPDTFRCQDGALVRYAPGQPIVMEDPDSDLCKETR